MDASGVSIEDIVDTASVASSTIHISANKEAYIEFLEDKLNRDIGWYYWKKYIAAAFWSQISLPVNLTITFLTALTAAQANTTGIVPESAYQAISIVTLVISVLNTFFRPHDQMLKNIDKMREWNAFGIQFEDIFYDNVNNPREAEAQIKGYLAIQDAMNETRRREGPEMVNFLTDLIHLSATHTCLRRKNRWLNTKNRARFGGGTGGTAAHSA